MHGKRVATATAFCWIRHQGRYFIGEYSLGRRFLNQTDLELSSWTFDLARLPCAGPLTFEVCASLNFTCSSRGGLIFWQKMFPKRKRLWVPSSGRPRLSRLCVKLFRGTAGTDLGQGGRKTKTRWTWLSTSWASGIKPQRLWTIAAAHEQFKIWINMFEIRSHKKVWLITRYQISQ